MPGDVINHPQVTTVDGHKDLSKVSPDDVVAVSFSPDNPYVNPGRTILMPAAGILTADRQPVSRAADGATERLDGRTAIKLGGQVLAVSQLVAPPEQQ